MDEDDSGRTIALRVGQQLRVTLGRQGQQWQPAQSSSAAVVRRSTQGGYPGSEPMVAVFEAQSRGQAQVSASTDLACFHTEPRCLAPQQQWSVTVTVS